MRGIIRLSWVVMGVLLLNSVALGQDSLRWQPTLEGAKRLAAQTDRLVLIHFWADWCQPCRVMDRDVYPQQEVISAMQTHFVPVRINADYFPATSKQYGVTALPVDVILTPGGQVVEKIQGVTLAPQYAARLQQVALAAKQGRRGPYVQGPPGPSSSPSSSTRPNLPPAVASAPSGPPGIASRAASNVPTQPHDRYASNYGGRPAAAAQAARPPQPAGGTGGAAGIPPGNPPLALDGYCSVQLCEDMRAGRPKWTLGNRRWGARHRGRTYLFAGPEQQRRFLADPDRYAAVFSGNDVVLAVERGQTVPGYREYGVLCDGKIYLFANEASLQQFSKRAEYYANWALQAKRPDGRSSRQNLR